MLHKKRNLFFKKRKNNFRKVNFKTINFQKVGNFKKKDPYKRLGLLRPRYLKGEYKKKKVQEVYTHNLLKINFKEQDLLKKGITIKKETVEEEQKKSWNFFKKRRVSSRIVAKIIITESENNVFGVVSTMKGKVLLTSSSGKMGLKKRKTPVSVELLGQALAKHLLERALFFYELFFLGKLSKLMRNMVRGLKKIQSRNRIFCKRVKIIAIYPHNGVRLKVAPRK